MLRRSTIQLLRFPFSLFLLPVYLFALGQVPAVDRVDALLILIILHVLVYPASNGYNSYMDRDEGSIGGVEKPLQPTRQLFWVSLFMDGVAIGLGLLVSSLFAACLLAYILASRAYSYRGIRLKQYPVTGYLTVILFQGAVTFFMVYHGSSVSKTMQVPPLGMAAASLLIGGFYPLTQLYQHEADRRDGVRTISALLGYRGTFVFTAVIYGLAMGLLAYYFSEQDAWLKFWVLATCLFPITVYFFKWAAGVWKDESVADYTHTMRMNRVASVCTIIGFLVLLIWK